MDGPPGVACMDTRHPRRLLAPEQVLMRFSIIYDRPSTNSLRIGFLLSELTRFTGKNWNQEDDITLVSLERSKVSVSDRETPLRSDVAGDNRNRRILTDFALPSERGNERRAMEEVARAVSGLGLPEKSLERLKTA